MTTKNRFLKATIGLATSLMVLVLASTSFAQGRYGTPGRGYSRMQVDRLIRQAENRSDQFVRMFDRALDDSRLDGRFREDRLNVQAMQLERHLNIIRQQFNRTNNHYLIRSHIANAMNSAQSINIAMRNRRFNPMVERQWTLLRSDLNRLAAVYNIRQIGW